MSIEGFDYKNFAQILTSQANDLLPGDFDEFQQRYVVGTIQNFATLAGEALYNDNPQIFNADQAMLITQIIAEWAFHKSVDLVRSGIAPDFWDGIMQKIAFTIFEVAKQGLLQGVPQDQLLQIVENNVKSSYQEALNELKANGILNEEQLDRAAHQSNIDAMMGQIQEEQAQQEQGGGSSDTKLLKLASVALLLRHVSQDKVQSILNKFNSQDANTVIQYMKMPDLEDKVDKNIAIKCLQEIKTNLPEPKTISPNKILAKLGQTFKEKDKNKVELFIKKERSNIRAFIKDAYEGEYNNRIPSKVANIIAQHLEENI